MTGIWAILGEDLLTRILQGGSHIFRDVGRGATKNPFPAHSGLGKWKPLTS